MMADAKSRELIPRERLISTHALCTSKTRRAHRTQRAEHKWNSRHVLPSPLPVYSQPIICKAGADLLRSHFLPTLDKLRKKTIKVRVSIYTTPGRRNRSHCSCSFEHTGGLIYYSRWFVHSHHQELAELRCVVAASGMEHNGRLLLPVWLS